MPEQPRWLVMPSLPLKAHLWRYTHDQAGGRQHLSACLLWAALRGDEQPLDVERPRCGNCRRKENDDE